MSSPIELGPDPEDLIVRLYSGASWAVTLELLDENDNLIPFPTGCTVQLKFNVTGLADWSAAVSGAQAVWNESVAAVAAVITASPVSVGLWFTTAAGAVDPWALGRIEVN